MKVVTASVDRDIALTQVRFYSVSIHSQHLRIHPNTNPPDSASGLILLDIRIQSANSEIACATGGALRW